MNCLTTILRRRFRRSVQGAFGLKAGGLKAGVAAVLIAAAGASAATPNLAQVTPRGAQRGTEVDVLFRGQRLADAKEVFVYDAGVTITGVEVVSPQQVKAHVKVAADARLGEYRMRLRTASGISELRNFYVGPYPVVMEQAEVGAVRASRGSAAGAGLKGIPPEKRPSTFESPQHIDLNVTVAGVIEAEQVDYFSVDCKKGQRLTAEVEGMRLGVLFDPAVSILDTERFELAVSDDTALLRQDCVASTVIPKDGTYVIALRESSYGGSANSMYRMHVGTFPRPLGVYPCGGKAGEEVTVRYLADPLGPFEQKIKLADAPGTEIGLFAEQNSLVAPSPNRFRISSFPNVMEVEPNDDLATATRATVDVPVALNGIIDKEGDTDYFRFKAQKGQVLDVRVFARQLRSPLDSVIVLYNDKGGQISSNDDSGGPDSYLRLNVPADGEYAVSIRDHLHRGGPDFFYRIEITPVRPSMVVTVPPVNQIGQDTQERQSIVVPKGNRFGSLFRVTRSDFGSDVSLAFDGLPEGISVSAADFPQGQDVIPVVFEASPTAAVAGKLCPLTAKSIETADAKPATPPVTAKFTQVVELVYGNNNNNYYSTTVDQLAVAVADEAPFKLQVVPPKVPVVQSGALSLKVVADRKPGFTGPINVKMLWDPPGVSSSSAIIAEGKSEAFIPLNAGGGATPRKWKTAVIGSADVNGPLWACSQLSDIEVGPAIVAMKLTRTVVEQGQTATVNATVDVKTPFEGKAKVELLGLPNGVTAPTMEIGPDDKQVAFPITTDVKSPQGTQNTLVCRVTVMKEGEPIVQSAGQGGVLRIDPVGGLKGKAGLLPAKK